MRPKTTAFLCVILLGISLCYGQGIGDLEKRVTRHTLKNGLRFLLLERHTSPTISFHVFFNVGSVDEQVGQTGIAHLYEHMAFKGTSKIGTRDVKAEMPLMKQQDQVAAEMAAELDKGEKADREKVAALEKKMEELEKQQNQFIIDNQLSELLERNGGVGLNAETGRDATEYYISLPANKLELWAVLESDRMVSTVLRQFYKERSVVQEERRMRTDDSPFGKLFEKFVVNSFESHPYGLHAGVGWPSDLQHITRGETEVFYKKYYVPANAIIAIVGDFNTSALVPMLDRYFAALPSAPTPPPIHTLELEQGGEKEVKVEFESQPFIMMGFHRPSANHPDDVVFDVITNLLSNGRTSRLYKNIVQDKQLAAEVIAWGTLPLTYGKYSTIFTLAAVPIVGHSVQEVTGALEAELERLKKEPVSQRELQKNINQIDAAFIRRLRSNTTMAAALTQAEGISGDWKYLIEYKDKVSRITAQDIQRVASKYFTRSNRTVAYIVPKPPADSTAAPLPAQSEEARQGADQLWQKALAARGGLPALQAVKNRTASTQIVLQTPQGQMTGTGVTVIGYPDKTSSHVSVAGQNITLALAGDDAWMVNEANDQVMVIESLSKKENLPPQVVQLQTSLEADPVALMVLGSDSSSSKRMLESVEGMPGILITLKNGRSYEAYFDPQTALLKRIVNKTTGVAVLYSDYKPIAGVQMPYKLETYRGSNKTGEITVSEMKVNVEIPEKTFQKPAGK